MCTTCGCNDSRNLVTITKIGEEGNHEHIYPQMDGTGKSHLHLDQGHGHHHHEPHPVKTVLQLEQDILGKNNLLAARNRGWFEAKNILAINLVSSPGSGKTTLLETTLHDLRGELDCFVIEGDQQSANDADRIAKTEVPVVQINTGKGCHLDAEMVHRALKQLNPSNDAVLFIENVGNLVCPALFDLGEGSRAVIISVTEGDDKPVKYPDMFHSANICIINKIDLLPYVRFDLEKAKSFALKVNPNLEFIELSATSGEGMALWYDWLRKARSRS